MDATNIIKSLGGPKKVADALRARGVTVADVTVRSWTLNNRAIPAKYWAHVAAVAEQSGSTLSFKALAEQVAA